MGCGASTVAKQSNTSNEETQPYDMVSPSNAPRVHEGSGDIKWFDASAASQNQAEQQPVGFNLLTVPQPADNPTRARSSTCSARSNVSNGGNRVNKPKKKIQKMGTAPLEDLEADEMEHNPDLNEQDRELLLGMLQKHFLFADLELGEQRAVCETMQRLDCDAKQVIFSQGDEGDCCYFIENGTFSVIIDDIPLKKMQFPQTFGELAMLYKVKRTATVACSKSGIVWKMRGKNFRRCMTLLSKKHEKRVMQFLENDPHFGTLKDDVKKNLAGACSVQDYAAGDVVLREGEVGDWMMGVMEGKVLTTDQSGNSVIQKQGAILGIAGLMYSKRQISGARAIDKVTCLAIGKGCLERLLGPVEVFLRQSAIASLLENHSFFRSLTTDQQKTLIAVFNDNVFEAGECLVTKGADAQLIIVVEGEVQTSDQNVSSSQSFTEYQPSLAEANAKGMELLTPGTVYGGKQCIESIAMPLFLVAKTQVRVHHIGCDALTEALGAPLKDVIQANEIRNVLQDIFLFKTLSQEHIQRVLGSLHQNVYEAGDIIVKQGDPATEFFLIQEGDVNISINAQHLRTISKWDYFGERALLTSEKRTATCQASTPVICLVLDSKVFLTIVGVFKRDLEYRIRLQDLNVKMSDLVGKAIVGQGGFGVVKLVKHKDDESKFYALKCVIKTKVVEMKQQQSIQIEREINAQCYHPCIMQFIRTFQDEHYVYFLTEFLGGGDLFWAIREIGDVLTKEQAQFYLASIIMAVEYLHERGIMYRDLKPENVLMDLNGYTKLVDFGCCKKASRSHTMVGTPEYLAPEIILGKGYTCSVDWWSTGVVSYEFLCGPLPFGADTEDQLQLFKEILEKPIAFPEYLEDEGAKSFMAGFLERQGDMRMGASRLGAQEMKEHPWFANYSWDAVANKSIQPPWKPDMEALMRTWEMIEGTEAEHADTGWDAGKDPAPGMEWAVGF